MENLNLPLLVNYAKWLVISIGLLYILTAFGLSTLAARLRQPHAWIAWIPVVNLYLLCRLAGSSALHILPAVIPVINLVVFAYLGTRIAIRVGKSPALGMLLGFPVLGAAVPLLLATGGKPIVGDPGNATSPFIHAMINAGIAAVLLVLVGAGFKLAGRMTEREIPTAEQAASVLPTRVAGTLTEFPIDTNTQNPAMPTNVVTKNFSSSGGEGGIPISTSAGQLPPWISPDTLPAIAENATFADYHTNGSTSSVSVVTLTMRDNNSILTPPLQAELQGLVAGAKVSGIELNSAAGAAYKGYRVSSPDSNYYALQRSGTNTAVIISANEEAGIEIAERLASNIGNGQGLLEYEEYRSSFGQMPSTPAGATMEFMQTYTEDDIAWMVQQFNNEIAQEEIDPEFASMIEMARAIVPSNVSVAAYTTPQREKMYGVAVAGYSSSSISWTALQTVAMLQSIIPGQIPADVQADLPFTYTLDPIEIGGTSGYAFDVTGKDGEEFTGGGVLLRRGASIVLMGGAGYSSRELFPWIEQYVGRN